MSKKNTYVNIGGLHIEGVGSDAFPVETGETITTTRDLVKRYPQKFRLQNPVASDDNEEAEDVTDKFETAKENDLVVKKSGKEYTIFDEGDEVETEKKLTSQKAVQEAIEAYIEEE